MRIEIEHKSPHRAALVLKATMDANGGEWIANAVGAEGYVVARVGSLAGKRLSRSGAAGLCGPFAATDTLPAITEHLAAGRKAYHDAYGPDTVDEPSESVYLPAHEEAFHAMRDGLASVDTLIKATGRSEASIKHALLRLRKEGRIELAVPSRGGHAPTRALYRMVA